MSRQDYDDRQAARAAALRDRADAKRRKAAEVHQQAQQRADLIPFGQPILVGHHSERRDRNFREKIRKGFKRSFELSKEADAAEHRAQVAGTGGVSADDPNAITKLRTQLANMESNQQSMTAINAAWRRAGKPAPDNLEGWKKVADLVGRSDNDLLQVRTDMARCARLSGHMGKVPFEPYALSNNSANMRRIRDRIDQLTAAEAQAQAMAGQPVERTIAGIRVVENFDDNRLQLIFPDKPSAEVRDILKGYGFRWAPSATAWQRQLNDGARYAADQAIAAIGRLTP